MNKEEILKLLNANNWEHNYYPFYSQDNITVGLPFNDVIVARKNDRYVIFYFDVKWSDKSKDTDFVVRCIKERTFGPFPTTMEKVDFRRFYFLKNFQ